MQLMRILIACHNADFGSALKLYLQNKNDPNVVAVVTDFQTMMTQAQATLPEIILLDWHLSNRSQEEVIRTLKQLDPEPAVILVNVEASNQEQALVAGADYVIPNDGPAKRMSLAIQAIRLKHQDRMIDE
jgi:DNA-binding NarL/FixJ family response regulator